MTARSTKTVETRKSPEPVVSLTVVADIPEAELRREFNEMVAEGYGGSWGDYLNEQKESFLDRAAGWWLNDRIAWGVRLRASRPKGGRAT